MAALIDRLKSGVPELVGGLVQSASAPSLSLEKAALAARRQSSPYASMSLDALVDEVGPLTQGSVLVGACDDRLHFYMDLLDPRPGSVLITAERTQGQTRLLQSILSSAVLLNSHRSLRYACLFADPQRAAALLRQPHCYRSVSAAAPEAGEVITRLADLAESRARPGQPESLLILAIDSLDALCARLADRAYDDLAWLLQNGPSVRVWPFATLDVRRSETVGSELIQLFGTRLLGAMDAKSAALFQGNASVTSRLLPDKQFCVWFDDQWLSFWVPEPAAFLRN